MTLQQLRCAFDLLGRIETNQRSLDTLAAVSRVSSATISLDPVGRDDAIRLMREQQRRYVAALNELGIECTLADFGAGD